MWHKLFNQAQKRLRHVEALTALLLGEEHGRCRVETCHRCSANVMAGAHSNETLLSNKSSCKCRSLNYIHV